MNWLSDIWNEARDEVSSAGSSIWKEGSDLVEAANDKTDQIWSELAGETEKRLKLEWIPDNKPERTPVTRPATDDVRSTPNPAVDYGGATGGAGGTGGGTTVTTVTTGGTGTDGQTTTTAVTEGTEQVDSVTESEGVTTAQEEADTNVSVSGQTVSDPVLQAIESYIQMLQSGGTPQQQAQQAGLTALLSDLRQSRSTLSNPDVLQAGIQGEQARLTQELMESILPQISGAREAAGQGSSAVGALLAQKAATQTGEAQARLALEAQDRNTARIADIDRAILDALQVSDPALSNLVEIINAAKGTVTQQQTDTSYLGETNTEAAETVVQDQTGTTVTNQTVTEQLSPQEIARLEAETALLEAQLDELNNDDAGSTGGPYIGTGGSGSTSYVGSGGGGGGVSAADRVEAIQAMDAAFPNGKPQMSQYSGSAWYERYQQDLALWKELNAIING